MLSLEHNSNCLEFVSCGIPYKITSKMTMDHYGSDLLSGCVIANSLLALKNNCQDLLKARSEKGLDAVIVAADFTAYAYARVFLSDAKLICRRAFT